VAQITTQITKQKVAAWSQNKKTNRFPPKNKREKGEKKEKKKVYSIWDGTHQEKEKIKKTTEEEVKDSFLHA